MGLNRRFSDASQRWPVWRSATSCRKVRNGKSSSKAGIDSSRMVVAAVVRGPGKKNGAGSGHPIAFVVRGRGRCAGWLRNIADQRPRAIDVWTMQHDNDGRSIPYALVKMTPRSTWSGEIRTATDRIRRSAAAGYSFRRRRYRHGDDIRGQFGRTVHSAEAGVRPGNFITIPIGLSTSTATYRFLRRHDTRAWSHAGRSPAGHC